MGDDTRSGLRSALDDLSGGLRSALGLEERQPHLIDELLGDRVGGHRRHQGAVRDRVRTAPRRRRSGPSPLVVVKWSQHSEEQDPVGDEPGTSRVADPSTAPRPRPSVTGSVVE